MKKVILIGLTLTLLIGGIVALVLLLNNPGPESNPENATEITRRSSMERFYVQDADARDALCNDGSDPVYHFRPAEEGFEDKWVVWFEGGGSCNTEENCAERWSENRNRMSTRNENARINAGGILSMDEKVNPDFYQWNHVRLNYCSSDSWTGDKVVEVDGRELIFNGKNISQAMFEDLSDQSVFGSSAITLASQVLITGTSAGGGGAAQNINDIAEYLEGVDVRGVIDSSWIALTDDALYSPEEREVYTAESLAFRNNHYDDSCVADHVHDPEFCRSTPAVSTYWTVPVFVYVDQIDKNTLETHYGIEDISDPAIQPVLDTHADVVASMMRDMPAVFSPRTGWHGAITGSRFNSIEIDGYSFQEVLGNWYFDREGPVSLITESR